MKTTLKKIDISGQAESYLVSTADGDILGTIARASRRGAWSVVACTRCAAVGKHLGNVYSKEGAKFLLTEHFQNSAK